MTLIKGTLKASIQAAMVSQYDGTPNAEQTSSMSDFADDLASAIDAYIKSATIIVPPGQVVLCAPYPGATTAPSPSATIT